MFKLESATLSECDDHGESEVQTVRTVLSPIPRANCVISSSRPWPWVLGVSVAVSFVLLALFYVYKRQVSKKESSGEENFELLQYEIPNARTHFGPEGFFLAQDDSGDLLFDKNSEKGWMLDI